MLMLTMVADAFVKYDMLDAILLLEGIIVNLTREDKKDFHDNVIVLHLFQEIVDIVVTRWVHRYKHSDIIYLFDISPPEFTFVSSLSCYSLTCAHPIYG